MIDQLTIDRILAAADIVDVISDYVTLRRSGSSFKGLCPFHDDKTPSFYVSPSRGVCKCFSCGKGGNVVHFLMGIEQIGYVDALKMLAKRYGIEVKEKVLSNEERIQQNDRESMFVLNEWASHYFNDILLHNSDGRAIGLTYFRSRGFRDDIIEKFRLGFSLDDRYHPDTLFREAVSKGFKEEFIFRTSLCYRSDDGKVRDKFRGRAIFPWFNVSGKVCGFGGRVLDARTKGVSQKYINSNDSEVFHKSHELYGLFQAKKAIAKEDRVFMVEGYTDVLSMHQCGIENVVANSGTALDVAQVRLLHRFTSNITLLYDGDEAGIHAAQRGTDMFLSGGMNVKVLLLPDGEDPDSFARNHSSSELEEFIAQNETDFLLFKTRLLLNDAGNDPVKKSNLIGDIVTSISVVPDSIKRELYAKECSELMGIDERILHIEINKRLRKKREQWYDEEQRELQKTKPVQLITDKTISVSNRCREYESELLTILINYGNDVLFTIAKDDEPSVDVTVEQYIEKELNDSDIEFQTPICRRMFDLYTSVCNHGQKPGLTTFTLNSDAEISKFAVDLLVPKNEVSNDFWKRHNPYIAPEDRDMKAVIDSAIYGYKAMIVQQSLDNMQKTMKELQGTSASDNEFEIDRIMKELLILTNYKKRLNKYLNRVMV